MTGVTGAGGGTATGAGWAVAVSGGGGGIDDTFVSSAGFAVVTSAGAGFSELPVSAQTPTPATTTTAAAPTPIQIDFFEEYANEAEDSASIARERPRAGGTVGVRLDAGSLGGERRDGS
jgi:hypothetical protein